MGQAAQEDSTTKCTLASGIANGNGVSKPSVEPAQAQKGESLPEFKPLNLYVAVLTENDVTYSCSPNL